jgi:predicted DCC family thiol-disulfide oxidoreductase YuxK
MNNNSSQAIVLFDGVCGLCNRLIQFLLKRDTKDKLRFASLQSDFARTALKRHNLNPLDLDTVHVIVNYGQPDEQVLSRSDAIICAVQQLGGIWRVITAGKLLPRSFRDAFYALIARNRYAVFGKSDSCMLPEPHQRQKFIEV